MPHGDFSDVVGIFSLLTGLVGVFRPNMYFEQYGPVLPLFAAAPVEDTLNMVRFAGSLLIFMGVVLYCVRWNTLNGKAAAIGATTIAINTALIGWNMDNQTFVLRGWYVFSAFFALGALKLCFFANPMLTSAMLLEQEQAKANKKK